MDVFSQLALDKIGFALAGLANLFFFLLILVTRVKNLPRFLLLTWALISICWSVFYMLSPAPAYSNATSLLLELARNFVLMLFLLSALGQGNKSLRQLLQSHTVVALTLLISIWFVLSKWQLISVNLMFTGSLALYIFQLALLEAMYRKAAENKWQYKPLVLSITVCTAFDFILLAEAALFGQIDAQMWAARGFICAAMVPFLIIAVRRIQAWGISVYVSRDIVLQSTLVLTAGLYLCLIAIAGFYIRYIGGQWSNLLQAIFLVLGFTMLAGMLLSGALRRRLKVFIEKHFFANKFDYRLKWLELTRQLRLVDITKPEQYDTILQAWLSAIGYNRGCLLRIGSATHIVQLACYNRPLLSDNEKTLVQRYVAKFASSHWLVDLSDSTDPFTQQQSKLSNVDIQLIVPIHSDGKLWGLCLMNTPLVDRQKLNWELRDYLMLVTEQISSYLMLMQASKALSENAQFAAFSRMSAFVLHDLKNVKAQIDLMLQNSIKHKTNPEFINDSFDTLAAMQQRLDNMLSQLSSKRSDNAGQSVFNAANIVQQIISQRCAAKRPLPILHVDSDAELSLNKERFASVVYHLIDNAQHATPADGEVKVSIFSDAFYLTLEIADTGCGMSADFINQRLFKPFDSTKGNAGMGVGAYDALHFAEQHNGQLHVSSTEGTGSIFTLKLPRYQPV
ncbi:XrtA/PEP-CTERM system histidine kinase PrsK [Rheinheimera sp.]|uniref:XrtA/PEP-CTERM system histidine kinase PrsK n=1 Tax=Rheinheimera sp. TaxID=1869214 RepID=UPI00273372E7|nr:XrtA/PEP-CTERM system histidine kinase PrsK [Rheinheimera sp.]MDP2715959.1 PEP-CTERM system histidine kinase PrsK [Rheinheimera sp.]